MVYTDTVHHTFRQKKAKYEGTGQREIYMQTTAAHILHMLSKVSVRYIL